MDKNIVERIIGDMLLDVDSDDDNLNSAVVALRIFQLEEDDDCEGVDLNSGRYLVVVPNLLQFKLVVRYIRSGLSFRQCCEVLKVTKETKSLGQIGCTNMSKVIACARYICAMAYQMISDLLKSVWAFSIALDGGNKSSTSYLDVRLRFSVNEVMHNIHLVALPMRERHTGQYMFNIVSDLLGVLCENWESKLIGITSDGKRLTQVSLPGCYRVWCAAHQMDLVVQKIFLKLCSDSFVSNVMSMTGHLRRQTNLILGTFVANLLEDLRTVMNNIKWWFIALLYYLQKV